MKYYIFKNEENNEVTYGYLEESYINPEHLEAHKESAFRIIDKLPEPLTEKEGTPYRLRYDKNKDTFYWEYI